MDYNFLTAKEFLKSKGLIKDKYEHFIITHPEFGEIDLAELMSEWVKPPMKKFNAANDFQLSIALSDFEFEQPPLRRNLFQTIGDRVRFIEKMENNGFAIVRYIKPLNQQKF